MDRAPRRALTVPAYLLALPALLALSPLLAVLALAVDRVRSSRGAALRTLGFALLYLGCEVAGILAAFGLWLATPWLSRERSATAHYRLQAWWAGTLLEGACRLYGMTLASEGDEALAEGPVLVFARHASLGDTVLPAVMAARRGLRLRYVIKRELLIDPCLDIVGHRIPNVFVRRGSEDSAREIAAVARLAEDLSSSDGILIYPEGTRFSEAKRDRILEKMAASGDAQRLAWARAQRHVLPPRLGGPLALLDAAPDADVVFCAHVGFEGASHFSRLAGGDLVGRTIRLRWWRVPRSEIPKDQAGRIAWLFESWGRVDRFVGAYAGSDDGTTGESA